MTQHNVGALVVVKPGEQQALAGIITERGKIRSDQLGKFFFCVSFDMCDSFSTLRFLQITYGRS